jgi:CTP:molybdopterin cytidylyltransferase MocA
VTPAPVTVLILAPAPAAGAGPLSALLDAARTALAERHRVAFLAAGAGSAVVRREPADETPFGTRLARVVRELEPAGLVVLGAGSIPLATPEDLRAFVDAAAADIPGALANSFYSADAIAIACAGTALEKLPPDLDGDNALPRWLAEVAGIRVRDLRARRDLAVDVDSPLDVLLLEEATPGVPVPDAEASAAVRARVRALGVLAADPAAELLVAGRIGAADLARLERDTSARTRAFIEERGLRTASLAASRDRPNRRPPRSLLADLLDRDGPDALGTLAARFSDGALVDTRVLLAARLGADERGWPAPEDRYASDLLLPEAIVDPWLRDLTASALNAPVPVLVGGHTLVGPGAPLALGLGLGVRA